MQQIAQAPSLRRTGAGLRARQFPAARGRLLRRLRHPCGAARAWRRRHARISGCARAVSVGRPPRRRRARHGRFPWRRSRRARASSSWLALVSARPVARSRLRVWLALLAFHSASSAVSRSSSRSASASVCVQRRGRCSAAWQGRRPRWRLPAPASPRFAGQGRSAPRPRPDRVPFRGRCRLRPGRSAGGSAAPLRGRALPRHPAVRAATTRR